MKWWLLACLLPLVVRLLSKRYHRHLRSLPKRPLQCDGHGGHTWEDSSVGMPCACGERLQHPDHRHGGVLALAPDVSECWCHHTTATQEINPGVGERRIHGLVPTGRTLDGRPLYRIPFLRCPKHGARPITQEEKKA